MDDLLQKKYALDSSVLHGESVNARTEGIKVDYTFLPTISSDFALEDIYNLDETGLLFRQLLLISP